MKLYGDHQKVGRGVDGVDESLKLALEIVRAKFWLQRLAVSKGGVHFRVTFQIEGYCSN